MSLSLSGWARGVALRRRYSRQCHAHIRARLPVIQAALDATVPGYVLLAGDSHAELVGNVGLGGLPLVNAGIGGLSARGCALYLPRLRVPARAGTAVLFTGSNDILAKAAPLSEKTAAGFEAAADTVLAWLARHADRVVVLAVPPITSLPLVPRELAAVGDYSRRLERLARVYGARFADPYADLRDEAGGLARPGTLADGVHLADYRALASRLTSMLAGNDPLTLLRHGYG